MTTTIIECADTDLVRICEEADQTPPYFGRAADLGLHFRGGFDHAEVATNGWSVKLHDRGMNGRSSDFVFRVPVADRDRKHGPAK